MNAVEIYKKAKASLDRNEITVGEFEEQIAVLKDVEPVVRCKKCKHRAKALYFDRYICRHPAGGMSAAVDLKDDDFCSYGERREGE